MNKYSFQIQYLIQIPITQTRVPTLATDDRIYPIKEAIDTTKTFQSA
ncbi:hypothetical protein HNP98_001456 [Hymenobacter sp. 9A]|uniref:Uncharacterized protein n=1 Tax=Hymenobacter caeli TaxID=2735894 RepID=A0ABX2FQC5_9BACT|nr:hypothetical protein [Hymenobacter caeli]